MKRCAHCWHRHNPNAISDDVRVKGYALLQKMNKLAEDVFEDPEARELWLIYCCLCRCPRLVPLRFWQTRTR